MLKPSLEYLLFGKIKYNGVIAELYRHSKTGKYFIYDSGQFIIINENDINFEEIVE